MARHRLLRFQHGQSYERVVFSVFGTTLRTAALKFTRVTISSIRLDKVPSLLGSRHSVGCWTSLESSSPADSRTRSLQSNFV